MTSRLKGLQVRYPCIGDVRGLGAMVGDRTGENGRAEQPNC